MYDTREVGEAMAEGGHSNVARLRAETAPNASVQPPSVAPPALPQIQISIVPSRRTSYFEIYEGPPPQGAFQYHIEYRKNKGLINHPDPTKNPQHTVAQLKIKDREFWSDNKHGHGKDIYNEMKPNNVTKDHAQADVLYQAYREGIRADEAVLIADHKLCDSCGRYGGVRTWARKLRIKRLYVIDPSGRYIMNIE